jgi:hypothetical protein
MGAYQAGKLLFGAARPGSDRLSGLEEILDAARADDFERYLLGGQIIIQARLADADAVGNVLRRRAMIAALGKDASCRIDDFGRTAMRVSRDGAEDARRARGSTPRLAYLRAAGGGGACLSRSR